MRSWSKHQSRSGKRKEAARSATATRVAEYIFDQDQATVERPDDIRAWIKAMTYKPVYGADRT